MIKYAKLIVKDTTLMEGGSNVIIECNGQEVPNDESLKYKPHSVGLSWHDYLYNQWKSKTYNIEITNTDLDKFIDLGRNTWANSGKYDKFSFKEAIGNGIIIPAERVEVRNYKMIDGKKLDVPKRVAHFIDEIETQEDMICELVRAVLGTNFVSTPRRIELAKQKFKIIRLTK